MPLYIETELANYKAQRRTLAGKIAQREAFIDQQSQEAAEAHKLHGAALDGERKQLAELDELIAKQEKALAEVKEDTDQVSSPS